MPTCSHIDAEFSPIIFTLNTAVSKQLRSWFTNLSSASALKNNIIQIPYLYLVPQLCLQIIQITEIYISKNACQKRNSKQFYAIQNKNTDQERNTFNTASPGM
jgi:hypothetical protein